MLFRVSKQVQVLLPVPKQKPLPCKGFSIFLMRINAFLLLFLFVLYAYAYKSMSYYTPYAKRKCKTLPRPLLRTGAFSHTIQ